MAMQTPKSISGKPIDPIAIRKRAILIGSFAAAGAITAAVFGLYCISHNSLFNATVNLFTFVLNVITCITNIKTYNAVSASRLDA